MFSKAKANSTTKGAAPRGSLRRLGVQVLLCLLPMLPAWGECLKVTVRDPAGLTIPDAQISVDGRDYTTNGHGSAEICDLSQVSQGSSTATVRATHFEDAEFTIDAGQTEATFQLALKSRVETPVVVTGTPEPRELAEVNRSMTVLSVEDPDVPAWSFPDVLKQDSSIDVRERGPDGTQADLSIRGSTFDQVLVLVNGIRMNDAQTGHHSMDLPLPFETVSHVEVLHGSGATLYGSDAIGGTVNYVTRKPEGTELKLMGGAGEHGWNRQSVATGFKLGRWTQQTSMARDFSSGFREGRDFRNLAISSESFFDHSFGSTTVMFAYNDRPFGANGFYCPCDSWEQTGTKFVAVSQTIGRNVDRLQHRFSFSFRRHDDHFILFRYRPEVSQNIHQLDTYQGNYTANGRISEKVRWTGGLAYVSEGIVSTVAGDRRRDRGAGFFMLNLRPSERLTLAVGVREEVWTKWRGETSPTVSAGYWLGWGFKLRGQVGHAFRMPTFTDLHHRDPFNVGNPDLVPESAWNYEVGADWYSSRGTKFSATWFERRERDTIDWVRDDGASVFQSRNFQKLDFHGGELQFRQRLRRSSEVGANFTIIRASRLLPENAVSRYVFNFPRNYLSASYRGPLFSRLFVKMRLGVFNRQWQSTKALWDVGLFFDGGRWQPFVQATNLLNTHHEAFQGLPQPGRWFRGGVQLRVF